MLKKRQSKYGKVLEWLEDKMKMCRGKEVGLCQNMRDVVKMGESSD